jgi:hypothetical protein
MAAAETSPRLKARLAGFFYLTTGGTAFAEAIHSNVVDHTSAAVTAHNILSAQALYRFAFAADLAGVASYLVVTALLYGLLRPVSRTMSLLAAFFGLVGVAVQAAAATGYFAPLLILGGAPYLSAFTTAQLQAAALFALDLYAQGFLIALVFFGCYCVLLGYLIFRSSFLPRAIGVLMVIAGLALLLNSVLTFVAPAIAHHLMIFTLGLDGIGELSLMLWLLVVGVNVPKWVALARG